MAAMERSAEHAVRSMRELNEAFLRMLEELKESANDASWRESAQEYLRRASELHSKQVADEGFGFGNRSREPPAPASLNPFARPASEQVSPQRNLKQELEQAQQIVAQQREQRIQEGYENADGTPFKRGSELTGNASSASTTHASGAAPTFPSSTPSATGRRHRDDDSASEDATHSNEINEQPQPPQRRTAMRVKRRHGHSSSTSAALPSPGATAAAPPAVSSANAASQSTGAQPHTEESSQPRANPFQSVQLANPNSQPQSAGEQPSLNHQQERQQATSMFETGQAGSQQHEGTSTQATPSASQAMSQGDNKPKFGATGLSAAGTQNLSFGKGQGDQGPNLFGNHFSQQQDADTLSQSDLSYQKTSGESAFGISTSTNKREGSSPAFAASAPVGVSEKQQQTPMQQQTRSLFGAPYSQAIGFGADPSQHASQAQKTLFGFSGKDEGSSQSGKQQQEQQQQQQQPFSFGAPLTETGRYEMNEAHVGQQNGASTTQFSGFSFGTGAAAPGQAQEGSYQYQTSQLHASTPEQKQSSLFGFSQDMHTGSAAPGAGSAASMPSFGQTQSYQFPSFGASFGAASGTSSAQQGGLFGASTSTSLAGGSFSGANTSSAGHGFTFGAGSHSGQSGMVFGASSSAAQQENPFGAGSFAQQKPNFGLQQPANNTAQQHEQQSTSFSSTALFGLSTQASTDGSFMKPSGGMFSFGSSNSSQQKSKHTEKRDVGKSGSTTSSQPSISFFGQAAPLQQGSSSAFVFGKADTNSAGSQSNQQATAPFSSSASFVFGQANNNNNERQQQNQTPPFPLSSSFAAHRPEFKATETSAEAEINADGDDRTNNKG